MFDSNGNLIIKTLKENQELYQDKYAQTFGLVDIEPSSALGSDLAITAEMKKIADENVAFAFSQNSPYEATGTGLDNLCFLRGIKRKVNEHSVCLVTFSGIDGTDIPKSTQVEHKDTKEIFTTNEKGIISNGVFSVLATAVNSGRVVCSSNTLTKTTLEGVTVTNATDGILGFNIESDTDLRFRLLEYSNGLNIEEELYLRLKNIKNVKMVNLVSNPEITTDSNNNIPAKSTAIVVLGGENKLIANEIFKIIPADKLTFGNIQETIVSSVSNKEYLINFSRPTLVNIDMTVTLHKNARFNSKDVGVIKDSIISYFADKFKINDDVIVDSLYVPIQQDYNNISFRGIEKIDITLNGATSNVSIAYNEYASLNLDNLSIIVI